MRLLRKQGVLRQVPSRTQVQHHREGSGNNPECQTVTSSDVGQVSAALREEREHRAWTFTQVKSKNHNDAVIKSLTECKSALVACEPELSGLKECNPTPTYEEMVMWISVKHDIIFGECFSDDLQRFFWLRQGQKCSSRVVFIFHSKTGEFFFSPRGSTRVRTERVLGKYR